MAVFYSLFVLPIACRYSLAAHLPVGKRTITGCPGSGIDSQDLTARCQWHTYRHGNTLSSDHSCAKDSSASGEEL
jgi:hypothetical protein